MTSWDDGLPRALRAIVADSVTIPIANNGRDHLEASLHFDCSVGVHWILVGHVLRNGRSLQKDSDGVEHRRFVPPTPREAAEERREDEEEEIAATAATCLQPKGGDELDVSANEVVRRYCRA